MAVERYLLDEFNPEEREVFEEHFFCCEECAQEIKAGTAFIHHGREIVEQEGLIALQPVIALRPPTRNWLAWFRPAFAVPVMALILGVVVFQNLVQLPEMHRSLIALNSPAVLPNADLASGTSRGDEHVVVAKSGELFQLTIDIPDSSNVAHVAELYDSGGRKLWSLVISADAPKSSLGLKMPGDLPAGNYSLVMKQAGAAESSEVSRYSFVLRRL